MKPKKPRPRRPCARPDPRRLVAPPPDGFYHLPELELRGGTLLTDGCRRLLCGNVRRAFFQSQLADSQGK